jgi:hypothetical protein
MPTVEVAVADTVMVLVTVSFAVGDMREAERPVVLMERNTGNACGELEALGSTIVAVAL